MSENVTIRLPQQEMSKFFAWADKEKGNLQKDGKVIVEGAIRRIERMAKASAPVDNAFLRSSIHSEISRLGMGGSVYTARKYAPYQEWGTGSKVQVQTFVKQMFGVDSMEWKGRGIRKVNIKPQPYLFENARVGYNEMISKLEGLGFNKKDQSPK